MISGVRLTYVAVSGIIETIAATEKYVYIPGTEPDDLAQEVRMACVKAIPRYDSTRIGPSPFKFFQIIAKNRLYNMRRGFLVPNNPPCVRCEYWERESKSCIIQEAECAKIVRFRRQMTVKAALKQPASLEADLLDSKHCVAMDVDAFILDDSIRDLLPPELIFPYEALVSGLGDEVTTREKVRIRHVVRELLDDEA